MGAEWWIRNKKGKETEGPASVDHVGSWNGANDEVQGVVKARISTNSVRDPISVNSYMLITHTSSITGHFADVGRSFAEYPG
jgi:hypothetical protein